MTKPIFKAIVFIIFIPLTCLSNELTSKHSPTQPKPPLKNSDPIIELDRPQFNNHSFNIKSNLLPLIIGLADVTFEYKFLPKVTLSGSFIFGSFTQKSKNKIYEFDIKTFGGHIKTNYYFKQAYVDSFYTSLYFGILDFDVELDKSTISAGAKFSSPYIGANIGYVWHWERFNFALGAGYSHAFKDEEAEITIENIVGTTTIQVHYKLILEAVVGFTF